MQATGDESGNIMPEVLRTEKNRSLFEFSKLLNGIKVDEKKIEENSFKGTREDGTTFTFYENRDCIVTAHEEDSRNE